MCEDYLSAEQHFRTVEDGIGPTGIDLRKRWTVISNAGLGLCALRTGRVGEAARRLTLSPQVTESGISDPILPAIFESAMMCHRGRARQGAEFLAAIIERLALKLPLQALRLRMEEVRILWRVDPVLARSRATEGETVARGMGIHSHASTLALLARLGPSDYAGDSQDS